MWLVDVQSYKLKYFQDASQVVQKYAILSHRWEDDEVSHSDMTSRWDRLRLKRMKGWYKIQKCCEQAAKDGLAYAWFDTCCIDKTSSAELQEAINSMFRWYSEARVCYVFMSDVRVTDVKATEHGLNDSSVLATFKTSQWFTRGWTLQELLAPKELTFYDREWRTLGSRSQHKGIIGEITGIEDSYLAGFDPAWTLNSVVCVAQVMIWASGRKTTRVEDKAYSLLGLFGVSMPMLYGEGTQAFFRLQEQLLRTRDDQSIFAWTALDSQTPRSIALTDTPDDFVRLPPSYQWISPTDLERRKPPAVSSDGITFEALVYCVRPRVYHALLNTGIVNVGLMHLVTSAESPDTAEDGTVIIMMFAIPIREIDSSGHFLRLLQEKEGNLIGYPADKRKAFKLRSITLSSFVKRKEYEEAMEEDSASFVIPAAVLDLWSLSQVADTIEPPQLWPWSPSEPRFLKGDKSSAIAGLLTWNGWPHKLEWSYLNLPVSAIGFGYDSDFNPTCIVIIGGIAYNEVGFKQLRSVFEEGLDEINPEQISTDPGLNFSIAGGRCSMVRPTESDHPAWASRGQDETLDPSWLMVFKTVASTRWSGKGFHAVIRLTNGQYDHYHRSRIHIKVSRENKKVPWEINIKIEREATKIVSHAIAPKLTRFVQPRPAYRLGTWAEHGGEPGEKNLVSDFSISIKESE